MTLGLSGAARLAAAALGSVFAALPATAQTKVAPPVAASAQAPVPRPPALASRNEAGIRWQSLTPSQRQSLAPLEREWTGIDASRKQKWLAIADRYPSLPPAERARITERMTEWARLTPAERGEVRLRYQEAQQVPAPARSERWQEYQKLPPDAKQQLAARAAASAAAPAPRSDPSARPGGPARETVQAKSNVVPNPALAQRPRSVAPTVVQAVPGATTRFITRPTTPPEHQQSGMPKIAATPEFVNRTTLLPRRGPQAAAVTTVPSVAPVAGPTAPARPSPPPAALAKPPAPVKSLEPGAAPR